MGSWLIELCLVLFSPHLQKQVELRDAALADLNKATRKLQKAKKRPEAIKSQQAEARYEEIKQVYVFLNDEVKQQLEAYNSQRMLYIMPHLEKVQLLLLFAHSFKHHRPFVLTLPPPHTQLAMFSCRRAI